VTVSWENPPTTIFIEMKFASGLATKTAGGNGEYPSDQLIRNIRVGLLECGWFQFAGLLPIQPREFAVIVFSPAAGHRQVEHYRDRKKLLASIPHSNQLGGLPSMPFVGEADYGGVAEILRQQRRWSSRPERESLDRLANYLDFKRDQFQQIAAKRQSNRGLQMEPFRCLNSVSH
jgi:hypothetical protein